jgi:hypothetical protein
VNTSFMNESTKVSSAISPVLSKTSIEELMDRMDCFVWSRVSLLMSVIAIDFVPRRAKPLATAAPIPMGG